MSLPFLILSHSVLSNSEIFHKDVTFSKRAIELYGLSVGGLFKPSDSRGSEYGLDIKDVFRTL